MLWWIILGVVVVGLVLLWWRGRSRSEGAARVDQGAVDRTRRDGQAKGFGSGGL